MAQEDLFDEDETTEATEPESEAKEAPADDALPEAARVSGAKGFFLLRTIWAPLVLPSIVAGWFLVFMPSFSELTMSVLLVGGKTDTIGNRLYHLLDYEGPMEASVLATVILAFVIGSNLLLRVISKGKYGV